MAETTECDTVVDPAPHERTGIDHCGALSVAVDDRAEDHEHDGLQMKTGGCTPLYRYRATPRPSHTTATRLSLR